jgi:hypothetical protein
VPLIDKLRSLGYTDEIDYQDGILHCKNKESLDADALFFVEAGYRMRHTYFFAISAPKYDIKGVLQLELSDYHDLAASAFANRFNIEVEQSFSEIVIHRQYGMRKILTSEFDPNRYILRKGFPDFPTCPYGHTFKMLGYDTQTNEYVRLASSILKDERLKTVTFKENK